MAISLEGTNTGSSGINTSTLSFEITVPAGTDFLTVGMCLNNFTGTISSVVFNTNEGMQQRIYQTNASSNRRTALFFLVNPTVTTANVVITLSANAQQILAAAHSWSGVDANSGTNGAADGRSLAPSATSFEFDLTTTENNSVVVDAFGVDDEGNPAPSGDNTGNGLLRNGNQADLGASFATIATAGTANMDWSLSALGDGSMVAMELIEAAAGGGNDLLLLLHARGDD